MIQWYRAKAPTAYGPPNPRRFPKPLIKRSETDALSLCAKRLQLISTPVFGSPKFGWFGHLCAKQREFGRGCGRRSRLTFERVYLEEFQMEITIVKEATEAVGYTLLSRYAFRYVSLGVLTTTGFSGGNISTATGSVVHSDA